MKFEEAIKLMLRSGYTIRRECWGIGKCMFIDIDPRHHRRYLVRTENWHNDICSLESEDIMGEDWECCSCPDVSYPNNIKPATINHV